MPKKVMFLLIEFCFVLAAVAIAFTSPGLGASWFARVERRLAALARRRWLAVVAVGLTALLVRLTLLPILPIPQPGVHDEFSYLFAADTFAHGRLANPTHPMWIHFETFHINQKPSYVSMVYPGQGLFLAAGQVIAGHPFWGVFLSVGLMCASICWMLQGWLPSIWALLGGLLAVIRLGSFSYWANSYSGGALAALGGALVLGALPRIRRHARIRDALVMGLGLAILANTRPYESVFLCLPAGVALFWWTLRRHGTERKLWTRNVLIPLATVLLGTLVAMGYYFWRTTGSPFRTPYLVNVNTYNPVPYFPWQPLKAIPEYHHEVMKVYYLGWTLEHYEYARLHPIALALSKAVYFLLFYLGPVFVLPIFLLGVILPYGLSYKDVNRKSRFLLLVFGVAIAGSLLPIYSSPHYLAPLTAVVYVLILQALQYIRRWRWKEERTGLFIVRAVPIICIALFGLRMAAGPLHLSVTPVFSHTWCSTGDQNIERARLLSQFDSYSGRDLVLVKYSPLHDVHHEWVYNSADIDASRVVWARDMGPLRNAELLKYFSDRRVWLVQADQTVPDLVPYEQFHTEEHSKK